MKLEKENYEQQINTFTKKKTIKIYLQNENYDQPNKQTSKKRTKVHKTHTQYINK